MCFHILIELFCFFLYLLFNVGVDMQSLAQFKVTFESIKDLLAGSTNSTNTPDSTEEEKEKEKENLIQKEKDKSLTAVGEDGVVVVTQGSHKTPPVMFPTQQMVRTIYYLYLHASIHTCMLLFIHFLSLSYANSHFHPSLSLSLSHTLSLS